MVRIGKAAAAALAVCLTISVGGCATGGPDEVLRISAASYDAAFSAALEAAREGGMPAALRDRRGGLIETDAVIAPSIIEPWRADGTSLNRRVEQTIALQRRYARMEFISAALASSESAGDEALAGPDLFDVRNPSEDLTRHEGDLELRVWVYLEQAHTPGLRRGTWSRANTTRSVVIGDDGKPMKRTIWTVVARDRAFERYLLSQIRKSLASAAIESPNG